MERSAPSTVLLDKSCDKILRKKSGLERGSRMLRFNELLEVIVKRL